MYPKEQQIGDTVHVQGDEYLINEFQRRKDEQHLKPKRQPVQVMMYQQMHRGLNFLCILMMSFVQKRPVTPQMTRNIRLNDAKTKRVPKFTSFVPVENEKDDDSPKPNNDKWMKDEGM